MSATLSQAQIMALGHGFMEAKVLLGLSAGWHGTARTRSMVVTATGTRVALSSQAWDQSSSNLPTAVEPRIPSAWP